MKKSTLPLRSVAILGSDEEATASHPVHGPVEFVSVLRFGRVQGTGCREPRLMGVQSELSRAEVLKGGKDEGPWSFERELSTVKGMSRRAANLAGKE